MNDFDHSLIKNFVEKSTTTSQTYVYDNDSLCVMTYDRSIENSSKHKQIIQTVGDLLNFINVPKGFECYLFLIDEPKVLKEDEWPERKNVNSGFATPHSNEIFIYRSEEYERVILHECIHALGLDWDLHTNTNIAKTLFNCWKLEDDSVLYPHLFEAWTELYAEWLYFVFYAKPTDNLPILWDCQRAWQDNQAIQILARYKKIDKWIENTNVFAYYVLKACLAPMIGLLFLTKTGKDSNESIKLLCHNVHIRLDELKAIAEKTAPKKIALIMINPFCIKE